MPNENKKLDFKKVQLVFLLFFLFCIKSISAQNLISNPSFESYIGCPITNPGISNVVNNWYDIFTHPGSVDYYNTCAGSGSASNGVGVPENFAGYQFPNTGNGYIGMAIYGFREYVYTYLNNPLIAAQVYQLSFKVSLGDNSMYSANKIGGYFSLIPPVSNGIQFVLPYTPQVVSNTMINDTTNWMTITMNYTAQGGEQYLTIGNFFDNANTNTALLNPMAQFHQTYIYLDDFELKPIYVGNIQITGDSVICFGDSTVLKASNSNSYNWYELSNPTQLISTDSIIKVSPNQTTTYVVQNATSADTFTVVVNTPPTIHLGNDTTFCNNQPYTLFLPNTNYTYQWQDNSTNSFFSISTSGKYWVHVTNGKCVTSDTINVQYINPPNNFSLGNDSLICNNQAITLVAPSNYTYLWNTNEQTQSIQVNQAGIYSCTISNVCGSATSLITVQNRTTPNTTPLIKGETNLCENGIEVSKLLFTTSPYELTWSNGLHTQSLLVQQVGEYQLTEKNQCGEHNEKVNVTGCIPFIVFPTAFSPNEDGKNDEFKPITKNINEFTYSIYNRYGNCVFTNNNAVYGWDGKYKTVECAIGTYFYMCKYTQNNQQKILKGNFELVR